jgi:membrane protein implicated in regulation of membrane protease activity
MLVDYIQSHQAEFWIAIGFLLLAIEVLVMGFSTLFLFFIGLGALVTGFLMTSGLLPETWTAGISSLGICSAIVAGALWQPLHRMQGKRTPKKDVSSDFTGLEFVLEHEITTTAPGTKRYSGINWKVEIDSGAGVESVPAGQRVVVASVDVGLFRVKPV